MLWIYLAALEETPSHCANGSTPSPTAKPTVTPKPSFSVECQTANSSPPQSVKTCNSWTETNCADTLTLSLQASPARTLALSEKVQAWKASVLVFSSKYCAWPKKYNPPSYSSKTFQESEHEDLAQSFENLPPQGMTVDGRCYPLQALAHLTKEGVGSVGLSTPTARMQPRSEAFRVGRLSNPAELVNGGKLNPQWIEWLMGFTTDWTALNDLGMQWFRSKREKPSKC